MFSSCSHKTLLVVCLYLLLVLVPPLLKALGLLGGASWWLVTTATWLPWVVTGGAYGALGLRLLFWPCVATQTKD